MKQQRNNQQWCDELCGQHGVDLQEQAHLDLANYLYVVAYNYLSNRQHDGSVPALRHYTSEDLAALAQDYVQDVLLKVAADNFALLKQYNGTGNFTSWAAVVTRNYIHDALRYAAFGYAQEDIDKMINLPLEGLAVDTKALLQQVMATFKECLSQLTIRRQQAFIDCCIEDKRAAVVAAEIKTTEQAIYLLVMHAKRKLQACMTGKGFGAEVLELFEE